MVEVSIIVPTHNSEKYIGECLKHLIYQSFSGIEVLCVDSSQDQTQKIIKEYAAKDKRIRFITDKNTSYGYKLNRGIKEAKGEYIAFCDSDDYYSEKFVERLLKKIKETDVDFVKCNYIGFAEYPAYLYQVEYLRSVTEGDYQETIELSIKEKGRYLVGRDIWTGLYKKEFLIKNQILLHESEGASFQDTGFGILSAVYAEEICFIKDSLYYYRLDNVGSSVKANNKYLCICEEMEWIKKQMQKRGLWEKEQQKLYYTYKLDSYFWNIHRLPVEYQEKFRSVILDEIKKEYSENKEFMCQMADYQKKQLAYLEGKEKEVKAYDAWIETLKNYVRLVEKILDLNIDIVLFGISKIGKEILALQAIKEKKTIVAVCDNDKEKWGKEIEGYQVLSPENVIRDYKEKRYIIAANKKHVEEIKRQLRGYGILEEQIVEITDFPLKGQLLELL